jgi:HSP20 family protein
MANAARQNLFTDPFDSLLRGFLVRPFPLENESASQFPMDVTENEIAYRVRADLPGVRKEDIAVSVDGNTVTISAEVRADREGQSADRVLRSERYVGKLARSFTLGQDIERDGAEARYVDGVLELVLPKKSAAQRRRIVVG